MFKCRADVSGIMEREEWEFLEREVFGDALEDRPAAIFAGLEVELREGAAVVVDCLEALELHQREGGAGVGDGVEGGGHVSFFFSFRDDGDEEAAFCRKPEEDFANAEAVHRAGDEVEQWVEQQAKNIRLCQATLVCPMNSEAASVCARAAWLSGIIDDGWFSDERTAGDARNRFIPSKA